MIFICHNKHSRHRWRNVGLLSRPTS